MQVKPYFLLSSAHTHVHIPKIIIYSYRYPNNHNIYIKTPQNISSFPLKFDLRFSRTLTLIIIKVIILLHVFHLNDYYTCMILSHFSFKIPKKNFFCSKKVNWISSSCYHYYTCSSLIYLKKLIYVKNHISKNLFYGGTIFRIP